MKEKLAICVLFASKEGVFGPTFIRSDNGCHEQVFPETENELALVLAFLSIAEVAQFELASMTALGAFYNSVNLLEASARNELLSKECSARNAFTKQMRLSFRETTDAYLSSNNSEPSKKGRVEVLLESIEMRERTALLQAEETASAILNKQIKLFCRLFDPKKETEKPAAKKPRCEPRL
ncbi:MAG: hypothetical protein Q8L78_02735 [Coxiellaceae bacterium]|nr:hypothetical protein [Coxiellaceae bacterium]